MRFPKQTVKDRIGFFHDATGLRVPAFKVINLVQDEDPANQILATATALVALAEAIGVDPHDLIQKIQRAKHHIDSPFSNEYRAIGAYAQGEFL